MTTRFATCAFAAMVTACGGATTAPDAIATPSPTAAARPLAIATPSPRADGAAAFVVGRGGWMPILYLCDGVDGSRVAAISSTTLSSFAKPGMVAATWTIALGREDAGAGSIWRDLTDGGTVVGAVRSINPGMLGPPAATTLPTLSSVRTGNRETRCRWLPRARLLIVMPKRSAMVTRETDGSYTYRSFDYATPGQVTEGGEKGTSSTPTVEVRGGRLVAAPAGSEAYEFTAAPWTYRVTASARESAPGATVTVLKDGRAVSRAAAIAYEMAAARIK